MLVDLLYIVFSPPHTGFRWAIARKVLVDPAMVRKYGPCVEVGSITATYSESIVELCISFFRILILEFFLEGFALFILWTEQRRRHQGFTQKSQKRNNHRKRYRALHIDQDGSAILSNVLQLNIIFLEKRS